MNTEENSIEQVTAEVGSVEDIDAMLDQEFGEESSGDVVNETGDESTPNDELNETDTTLEIEKEEDTSETDSKDLVTEEKSKVKPTDDEKKEHAFSKVRVENADLKKQLAEVKKHQELLKEIAKRNGYEDLSAYSEAYKKAAIKEEATNKGYDPALYAQMKQQEEKIKQLEKKQQEDFITQKAEMLKVSIDKSIEEYGVTKEDIFNRLEEQGYTADMILGVPNPDILVKGVLTDKILEISKQRDLAKQEKLDSLSDEVHSSTNKDSKVSLDALIAEEMKEYKANFL